MEIIFLQIFITTFLTVSIGFITSKYANKKFNTLSVVGFLFVVSIFFSFAFLFFYAWGNGYYNNKKLQGYWFEKYESSSDSLNNYAITYFDVSLYTGVINFSGIAYSPDGDVIGHWNSNSSTLKNDTFHFLYSGTSKSSSPKNFNRDGFGKIFFLQLDGNYNEGEGYYISPSVDSLPIWFEIRKIINNDDISYIKSNPKEFIRSHQNN